MFVTRLFSIRDRLIYCVSKFRIFSVFSSSPDLANMVSLLLLRVAKPSQAYFGGAVKGESAMRSQDEIGSLVDFEFRVILILISLTSMPENIPFKSHTNNACISALDNNACRPQTLYTQSFADVYWLDNQPGEAAEVIWHSLPEHTVA